jgi:hypothetical protein
VAGVENRRHERFFLECPPAGIVVGVVKEDEQHLALLGGRRRGGHVIVVPDNGLCFGGLCFGRRRGRLGGAGRGCRRNQTDRRDDEPSMQTLHCKPTSLKVPQ